MTTDLWTVVAGVIIARLVMAAIVPALAAGYILLGRAVGRLSEGTVARSMREYDRRRSPDA